LIFFTGDTPGNSESPIRRKGTEFITRQVSRPVPLDAMRVARPAVTEASVSNLLGQIFLKIAIPIVRNGGSFKIWGTNPRILSNGISSRSGAIETRLE
jgi:hypothetical protein